MKTSIETLIFIKKMTDNRGKFGSYHEAIVRSLIKNPYNLPEEIVDEIRSILRGFLEEV